MSVRASLFPVLVALLAAACATGAQRDSTAPAGSSSLDRGLDAGCAAIADSVRASTGLENLPLAVPLGTPRLPTPRSRPIGEIRTTFLVDPLGRAVRGSIVTSGGADPEYERSLAEVILRTQFRAPVVAGCPSWGRGDFRMAAMPG